MLDAKVKANWVAALRSGQYKQIGGRLKRQLLTEPGFGFCCLGVLREIEPTIMGDIWANGGDRSLAYLSPGCGLSAELQQELSQMNDGYNSAVEHIAALNFSQIADYIEKSTEI